ncbi:sensor histidine kinase [Pseudomonas sp. ANT_H14]|uniref:sensor histidine kinase n=1 Tax=unclassified Pseudomonas TaxID=196821 RepID=UPI0011F00670|nr:MULTISPECIES: sensor histidine kinase [unclassified Pseudomonas]KAA0942653.1 sensor histidine kinase [Pseudomonas sp. ANT_H4]KAA0948400.1 sensor histidine kinase [Pseudomonas sp. ANT_H14]
MKLPNRHSLLWKLTLVLAVLCLLVVTLQVDLSKRLYEASAHLPAPTRQILNDYARQAETAWRERGAAGVDEFLQDVREREHVWAVVVDESHNSLSSRPLRSRERRKLDFVRDVSWSVGRPGGRPTFVMPFSDDQSRLVMELPLRLDPRKDHDLWNILLQHGLPASLALLFGALLYRVLIAPMVILRRQANALSAGDLAARVGPPVTRRRDELGELGRAFDHMAERLESTVVLQRRLLQDLSHELRTPLSRLRVAGEREPDSVAMRQRLDREVQGMERLIGNTLELVWLDTERPLMPLEAVEMERLWEVLREDACFESGWPSERLLCQLPQDCCVLGNLNGLAQALENILRNAIRHSPEDGVVRLRGSLDGDYWHLWIEDQGPGVDPDKLEQIFQPFTRLNAARPGGDGFGLGLSIARSIVQLQGGELWAENAAPGLRLHLRLKVYKL